MFLPSYERAPLVFAHRGSSHALPEHSLEAYLRENCSMNATAKATQGSTTVRTIAHLAHRGNGKRSEDRLVESNRAGV